MLACLNHYELICWKTKFSNVLCSCLQKDMQTVLTLTIFIFLIKDLIWCICDMFAQRHVSHKVIELLHAITVGRERSITDFVSWIIVGRESSEATCNSCTTWHRKFFTEESFSGGAKLYHDNLWESFCINYVKFRLIGLCPALCAFCHYGLFSCCIIFTHFYWVLCPI